MQTSPPPSFIEELTGNSLAILFQDVFKNGVDVIDLDVWLTADEKIAIHHIFA